MAENDDSEEPGWEEPACKWHYRQIGRLYEAAERNEQGITKAIAELRKTTAAFQSQVNMLPVKVAGDVNRELKTSFDEAASKAGDRIVQKFVDANVKADEATAAFERAANFAIWLPAAIILLAVIGGIAVATWFILPDAETVHALRMEEARLRANIEEWRRMEGADVLSHCGPEGRRCVRTEERAKELFGDRGETYRIIYGY